MNEVFIPQISKIQVKSESSLIKLLQNFKANRAAFHLLAVEGLHAVRKTFHNFPSMMVLGNIAYILRQLMHTHEDR